VPKDPPEDMRANFKSKEDDTGGDVASGASSILENPPVMGIFPDIMILFELSVTDPQRCYPKAVDGSTGTKNDS
jgi:hypothetical protein